MSSESCWKSLKAERDDDHDDDDDDDDDLIRPTTSMRYVKNYTTGNYNLTVLIILQIIHFNLDFFPTEN